MGGWLTDFETDVYVLGGIGQTITSPFYSLGNEMSPAYGWLPYLRDKFIVTGGIVQTFLDLGQLHPEGPVIEDVLQPVHLRAAVVAVAALRHQAGLQQADLVVPAQGAGGHPGQARQLDRKSVV